MNKIFFVARNSRTRIFWLSPRFPARIIVQLGGPSTNFSEHERPSNGKEGRKNGGKTEFFRRKLSGFAQKKATKSTSKEPLFAKSQTKLQNVYKFNLKPFKKCYVFEPSKIKITKTKKENTFSQNKSSLKRSEKKNEK